MIRRLACVCLALALSACGDETRIVPAIDAGPTPLPRSLCLDNDGDGFPGTGDCTHEQQMLDCNDRDPLVFPGALELCNGLDDNCNAQLDEGLPVVAYYLDGDGDGVGGTTKLSEGCKGAPDGGVAAIGDCDDANPAVRPGQTELCDGLDQDCDGVADNGLPFQDFYVDADGDGFGDANGAPVRSCQASVMGRVTNPADCNDANPAVKPGAVELCNKADDNCDGQMDNGIAYVAYYPDVDGDGYGDATAQSELSCSPLPGKVENDSDCNDAIATVKPGAPEVCNGADDDCDQQADEGLQFATYYPDLDGDGFGASGAPAQSSCVAVPGKVTNASDCNDATAQVKPTATEVCNGVDDNCSGAVDEGITVFDYYPDQDGDGFGAASGSPLSSCAPMSGRVANSQDCDDQNPQVKPGVAELCNGVDDNCSGQSDEGLTFLDYYPDGDGDGFGSASAGAQRSCTPVAGRVANNQDCNDGNAGVRPGATEVCNGIDDDCTNGPDDGLTTTTWYPDADRDGYGRNSLSVVSCSQPSGYVTSNTDCDDTRAFVYPGAPRLCNGLDNDCDGTPDPTGAQQDYYVDSDGDGFGAFGSVATPSCTPIAGRVTNASDCDDMDATIKPTATEICNGIDDNCTGGIDDGLAVLSYYPDQDSDGYGASALAQASCRPVAGKVTNNTDCNDADATVNPGRAEVCNGRDDNCVGGADDGLPTQTYYVDGDGDGFGQSTGTGLVSCSAVTGRVPNNGDCNDASAAIKPGATELCNGVDDNCAGGIDEGNPGGGAACNTNQSGICAAGTLTCVSATVTCVRNQGPRTETCNSLDDDCNGVVDNGFTGLGLSCTTGVGVCSRSGSNVCNAGGTAVVCSASAGSPTAAACDGLDNDCDGITDEPVLTSTSNVGTTAFTDIEVKPYYFSSTGCAGGANGTGTDALAGAALVMGAGTNGISFQKLDATGVPSGGSSSVTSLTYSDVDFAQAGDGFIIAGVYPSNPELDLYYVDSAGTYRTLKYSQFPGAGSPRNVLDSLRVVRGNGRRVTMVWREAGVGIKLAQVEACLVSGSWELRAPGCSSTTLTATTISPSTAALPGVGADSTHVDWAASQTCVSTATQRRIAVAYVNGPTSLNFFRVNENGTSKETETVATTQTSPRSMTDADVTYFRDSASADQFLLAFVTKDPGATTPQADLNYWLTSDPSWTYFTWFDYGTQNGVDSIARPRGSATSSRLWLSAIRYVADASTFKKQVMTRTLDLSGLRTPTGSAVEFSVTTGSCGADPACRPGDKSGFTNFAPLSRLYYAGAGSTPAGTFASALSCN